MTEANASPGIGTRGWLIVSGLMLASLLQLADATIVNVALPPIEGELGASDSEGAWIVTAYLIANVIVIPLTPWLQTTIGQRNLLTIAVGGFTVASLACGLANDVSSEIGLRFVQGAFGGGILVPAQQLMRDTFPPAKLGLSQTLFTLAIVVGPTIGPTLGGVLTDDVSWRAVFFINLVPGALATVLLWTLVRDQVATQRARADVTGIILLGTGLATLLYVLGEGERKGWWSDDSIVAASIVSVVASIAFVVWELRHPRPAIALRVLRHRSVWGIAIASGAIGAVMFGLIFILPQYSQNVLGMTTTMSGLLMMARAGMMLALFQVTSYVSARRRLDQRWVAAAGLLCTAAATWLQAGIVTTQSDFAAFVPTMMLGGIGLAFVFVPINVVLFQTIQPVAIAPALALSRVAQQIGGSIGIALSVSMLNHASASHQAALAGNVTRASAPVTAFLQHSGTSGIATLASLVVREAFNLGTADVVRALAITCAVAAIFPLCMQRAGQAVQRVPAAAGRRATGPEASARA